MKKTLLGLAFIALAVLVLLKETLGLGALPFWPLIWTAVFVGLTLKSLCQKHWYHGILFGLLTLVMLNSIYHWVEVSFWTLVLVGGLLLFGFNLLFAPSQNVFFWKSSSGVEQHASGPASPGVDLVFASGTRYVTDDNLVAIGGDVVFSSASLYFDQATMSGDTATYSGDAVFSSVQLFVPKNWQVELTGDRVFSMVTANASGQATDKTLIISGDYVFSRLVVYYV